MRGPAPKDSYDKRLPLAPNHAERAALARRPRSKPRTFRAPKTALTRLCDPDRPERRPRLEPAPPSTRHALGYAIRALEVLAHTPSPPTAPSGTA